MDLAKTVPIRWHNDRSIRIQPLATDARNQRFEPLAMPHLDAAFRLAGWLTGNTADAGDVVQDAYLPASRYLPTYLPTYLAR
jgi:DNA-directed RNA polymerase specialized sigma24 family protein